MQLITSQQEAFKKFSSLKVGALFMKQGTGKTRVALELIKSTDCDFVLFLCPFSTKANLKSEIDKWGLDRPFEIVGYETISSSDKTYLKLLDLQKQYINRHSVERNFIKNMEDKDVPEFKKLMEERTSKR